MDKSVIAEFETITNLAINKKGSERLDAVTIPSQAIVTHKKVNVVNQPKSPDFFAGLSNVLTTQQDESNRSKLLYL